MVTVVVAVRGLSPEILDIAAADEGGSFPVSSNLRILDFKSSNSSQTVDGAVVDKVDSVPSNLDFSVSSLDRSAAASAVKEFWVVRIVDRFDCRYVRNWPCICSWALDPLLSTV